MRFTRLLLALEAVLYVQATSVLPDIQHLESLASSALTTAYSLLPAKTPAGFNSTCNALSVQARREW